MNRIEKLFKNKTENILSVYLTAGYPGIGTTPEIIKELEIAGANLIEIGVPFSDPMADGPVIQNSNNISLRNGMNLKFLFRTLRDIRKETEIPLIMMSYCNPVLRFGMENFCKACAGTGIDGIIIPDLPPEIYRKQYKSLFQHNNLKNILMISPRTENNRIMEIDKLSSGFIYMVSSSATTGIKKGFSEDQIKYFSRVKEMKLNNPALIGFGISDHETYKHACDYASGAIIGSAFVKMLGEKGTGNDSIRKFISGII